MIDPSQNRHVLFRQGIFRQRVLGLLIAISLLMVGCNRNAPVTPTVIPLIPTTAPATPTHEAIPPAIAVATPTNAPPIAISDEGTIFQSPRYTYTVMLPCCWIALPTAGTALESALADIDMPRWGDLNERVEEEANGAVMELVALLPAQNDSTMPVAQMTISVLPASGLTLDKYMTATQAELVGIANTTVLSAVIEPELGVGGFPASLIHYTAASMPTANPLAEQEIAGLQVAFYGYTPETLIVLTFTTTIDRFAELEDQFLDIVRAVTFDDTAL